MFLLQIGVTMYSQEHLVFKGVEMNMQISKFAKELRKQGFVQSFRDENTYLLEGKFAGYDCDIYLYPNISKDIYKAVVAIDCYSWGHTKSVYTEFCTGLTKKYGEALLIDETFKHPYAEGDGKEITALCNDYAVYERTWILSNGKILLKMASDIEDKPLVLIAYIDSQKSVDIEDKMNADL